MGQDISRKNGSISINQLLTSHQFSNLQCCCFVQEGSVDNETSTLHSDETEFIVNNPYSEVSYKALKIKYK